MGRPEKLHELMSLVQVCVEDGRYLDTRHALDRQNERRISRPEILYVLRNGRHEKQKDKYDEFYQGWNYAVRGKTVDHRELRVIVAFDEPSGMLIITAIELKK